MEVERRLDEATLIIRADTEEFDKVVKCMQGDLEGFEERVDRLIVKLSKLSALAAALLVDTEEVDNIGTDSD